VREAVQRLRGHIDRLVRIEEAERRAPGVAGHADVPVGAMLQEVVVGGEDAEDEEDSVEYADSEEEQTK